MAVVTFDQVSKFYGSFQALRPTNLEIRDKEFMVLVGPSGCGKSTLLRIIAGLEEISSGTLSIDGEVVNQLSPKERDIAVVFQNYALYPHMTAYENLAFCLKIRGMRKEDIHATVQETARMLDIESILSRKPKDMSGGQRQRVAIGRAIVRRPRVFLFDEPLSNLDARLRGQMRVEIARLHKKLQTTIVYVTHDQVEAMTLGDRIAVMNAGEIQQIDSPDNLYRYPRNKFVAGFIGSPIMNFIAGSVHRRTDNGLEFAIAGSHQRVDVSHFPALAAFTDKPLSMGIRPEHLHAAPPEGGVRQAAWQVELLFVERLGHESYAMASFFQHPLTARLPASAPLSISSSISLFAELDQLHFFDDTTGLAIR
jgi:multiple sugar transport system ATP-binding protein